MSILDCLSFLGVDSSWWRPFHSRMVFGCYAHRTWEQVRVSWQEFLEDGGLTCKEVKMMPLVSSTYQTYQSYPNRTYHTHTHTNKHSPYVKTCQAWCALELISPISPASVSAVYIDHLILFWEHNLHSPFHYHTFCSHLQSRRQVMIHLESQGIGATPG